METISGRVDHGYGSVAASLRRDRAKTEETSVLVFFEKDYLIFSKWMT
jgi:hypothetical protein